MCKRKLKMILANLRTKVSPMDSSVAGGTTDFTLTNDRIDKHRIRDLANQPGNNWVISTTRREVVNRQTSFSHIRPGVSCHINDNYCINVPVCNKNAVELVKNQESLGFNNWLFWVPKPNNNWRPILDLSNLNKFPKAYKFKMETPETIRSSLQTGEWVTSIDFKDAYFYIPIQN